MTADARIFAAGGVVKRPPFGLLLRDLAAYLRDPPPEPPGAELPRGDGHAVLVFPPFLHGDRMTASLRRYLAALGYRTLGWGLGRCLGPSDVLLARTTALATELSHRHGSPLSLVGISLGGVLARETARRQPAAVRQVITLCSPFRLPTASNLEFLFRLASVRYAGSFDHLLATLATPLPVPTSAIFTRRDGIVAWQSCLNGEAVLAENIEVEGAHSTIGRNPAALAILADRLAQRPGQWRPYRASAPRRP